MGGAGGPKEFFIKGKRMDGRKIDELRKIEIEAGVIPTADGSCRLKLGDTEVLVTVRGPKEVLPRHLTIGDRAYIKCAYQLGSFSTTERARPGPSRRSREIALVMKSALEPAIMVEKYPAMAIEIYAVVINASAGTRCAVVSAAAVALADAGIEMRDLVSSVASGKIDGKIALDLYNPEDNFGQADLPLAILPKTGEISLLQMDGDLSESELKEALKIAMKGCNDIYEMQKEALRKRYSR